MGKRRTTSGLKHKNAFRVPGVWEIAVLVLTAVIVLTVSVGAVQRMNRGRAKATAPAARISVLPSVQTFASRGSFQIWADTGDQTVAFIQSDLLFNPSLLTFTGEAVLGSNLFRVVRLTTAANANSTGRVSLVLGLEPSKRNEAPKGFFKVAQLTFTSKTNSNASGSINVDGDSVSVIRPDTSEYTVSLAGASFTVNPTPTITPTPGAVRTPTHTPTPRPTAVPSKTPTPTDSPTATPTPLPSDSPTPTFTPFPSPTPVSEKASCQSVCRSRGYTTGSCTVFPFICSWFKRGTYVSEGNAYCHPFIRDCCCK